MTSMNFGIEFPTAVQTAVQTNTNDPKCVSVTPIRETIIALVRSPGDRSRPPSI